VDAPIPFIVEAVSRAEQKASFRVGDSYCRSSNFELRGGVRLAVTGLQFAPAFSMTAEQPAAELDFIISKGAQLELLTADGDDLAHGSNSLQLSGVGRSQLLRVRSTSEAPMECVAVSMSATRLRELLGMDTLPAAFSSVIGSKDAHPLVARAMTPKLYTLLDEILYADVKGPSRALWHEAKTLELIATMTDALLESTAPRLAAHDVERLERAKHRLVSRLDDPPTLAELARVAGLNETTLKAKFRAKYGTSVFDYLRQVRMEEARRLLLERQYNVTEVAQRVGYANPSKFAAAFRKQFAMPPSEL